jgi:hypothetical protein
MAMNQNGRLPKILKDGVAALLARFSVAEVLIEIATQRPEYQINAYPKTEQNRRCPTCGAEVEVE